MRRDWLLVATSKTRVRLPKVPPRPLPVPGRNKGGRPRTVGDTKPWLAVGISERTWYRRQGKSG